MIAKLFIASIRANAGRIALAVAGIALGVALGLAVHVINQSAIGEMQQATRTLSGDADLAIRGGRTNFDEQVLERILQDERVQIASPVVEAYAPLFSAEPVSLDRPRRAIKFVGIDIFRAPYLQPGFAVEPFGRGDRFAALKPDHVFVNRATLAALKDTEARKLVVVISGETRTFTIAGKIDLPQYKEPLAVMDIAGAQSEFQQLGKLSRIDLRLTPGANVDEVSASLTNVLPPGVTLATPAQVDQQSAAVSRAYRINLTVLSLVALFTGGFLVFTTQSLSVMRRRGQFALYRTLGVTRGELLRALLAEGALLGLISGIVGVIVGLAVATLVLTKFGADLGSGFFAGAAPTPRYDVFTVVFFALLGVAAGLAGAWLPAREAAREAPARALKARDDEGATARLPPVWTGLSLLALGAVLLALPAFDDIPWLAYASIACLLLGVLALAPHVCTRALAHAPRIKNWLGNMAAQHIEKSPGPAAAGITGVVASFSLMIAMLIMVVSFRSSLEQWLAGVLDADLYVRQGTGDASTFNPGTGTTFATIAGVEHADFLRYRGIVLDATKPERPPVTLIARPIRDDVLQAISLQRRATSLPGDLPCVWISEAVADLYGHAPGDKITLPLAGEAHAVVVAGVWRDYARSYGAIIMDRDVYVAFTGDEKVNDISLHLKRTEEKSTVIAAIRNLPNGERLEIADAAEIRKLSLTVFDRSFAVTYALEIAAIFVGLAGISATFSAQAWSRRREFGMLRHLGVTRREIAQLLASEGALLGALGAAIGLALGIVIALILVFVVNRQSFHWSMELHMPWMTMAALAASLVLLTALSAALSGRAAMSRQVVLSVKEDQ